VVVAFEGAAARKADADGRLRVARA